MEIGLIVLGCAAVFVFNLYSITIDWKRTFGAVTRGEFLFHVVFAALLPVGFIIALIFWHGKRWRAFWDRPLL